MRQDLGFLLRHKHAKILSGLVPAPVDADLDPLIRVEDGWYILLDVLCTNLQRETEGEGAPQVRATQVKEKFGRLRFRVQDGSERQRAMIYLAESLSERTCEVCGVPLDELAALLGEPRCLLHSASTVQGKPSTMRSRLCAWALQLIYPQAKLLGAHMAAEAGHRLNEAIRNGDVNAAKKALKAGAPLHACSLDNEGYHTPRELAARHGQAVIQRLLNDAVERAKLRRR